MNKLLAEASSRTIGFSGEQILSHIDEIIRTPCPKCGESDLSINIVGKTIIIRCSEALQEYNYEEDEVIPLVCDYVQVIKKTPISQEPFSFEFKEPVKRGTKRNSQPPTRSRRKRST